MDRRLIPAAALAILVSGGCSDAPSPFEPQTAVPEHIEFAVQLAPGADGALRPNEPAGFRSLTERSFVDLVESGWSADVGNPNLSILQDGSASFGPSAGQIRYPAGSTGGRTPAWTETRQIRSEGVTRLYASFRVKVSDNWQGHPTRVNKIGFFWTHDKPVVVPVLRGAEDELLRGIIHLQDVPDGARRLEANVGEADFSRGEWHEWEILLVSNRGGSANGEVHWWIDGRKVGEHTDVRFGTARQSKIWEVASWRPIWGGVGGQVRETMYMWMDRIYVSGK